MLNRFKTLLLIIVAVVALVTAGELSAAKRQTSILVAAGDHDRYETVVSFALPAELTGESYALRDPSGQRIPLQIDSERNASFVLSALKAGQTRRYQILAGESKAKTAVDVARKTNGLDLKVAGRTVFTFVTSPAGVPANDIKPIFLRSGYIHPVFTPSGRVVTDDYPSDHYHHHGIWFAWTKTEFEGAHPDFWNVGDGTGRVDFEAVDGAWSGPVHAGFRSRQRYVALTGKAPKTALNEQWDVRVYNVGQGGRRYYLFDIVATQQCASDSPLILEEYRYGGMGVRGHHDWRDKSKVSFLTSEGKTRESGNATSARWIHISGMVNQETVGIAVLDHPGNFRSPQPLRIHPDDPYFNFAPSQHGRFEIKPGEKYLVRYRYIVADGPPDKAELDRLWSDYATPPQVSLELK